MAKRLQADFPHLHIDYLAYGLHHLITHNEDLLAAADVIVAATGNWVAESALNRWRVRQGRGRPIVYGWTEANSGDSMELENVFREVEADCRDV